MGSKNILDVELLAGFELKQDLCKIKEIYENQIQEGKTKIENAQTQLESQKTKAQQSISQANEAKTMLQQNIEK